MNVMPGAPTQQTNNPRTSFAWLFALASVRHSFGGKLLIAMLLTTTLALVVAGVTLLITDTRATRASNARALAVEAEYLTLSLQGYLAFNDTDGAQRILQALQARPSVEAAALYDSSGRLVARYPLDTLLVPASLSQANIKAGVTVAGEVAELQKPVYQEQELLGTIFVRSHHDERARAVSYLRVLGAVLLLGLLVALLVAARLRRIVTRPLDSISDAARRVIDRNDFSVRAEKTTSDEIGVVVDAFNKMLDEVQSRTVALVETDKRKDEFLATLAHELRNPLAPIRNAVRIFSSPAANDQQRQWGADVIGRQVNRMALLLDDLLDVSRITRGKLELKKDYVELRSLLAIAQETARPLLDAKHHDLAVDVPDFPVNLEVDPLRLSQVVGNLLTNAAKYTDPHGSIELRAVVDRSGLMIAVKDNGIGIQPENMGRLFTMFSQVDSAVDRAEGGLGIGLALAKGLVELHGGTIEVRSDGLGRGSEFRVYLPAKVIVTDAPAVKEAEAHVSSWAGRCKVLVVDDNKDAAESLAMVLKIAGYEPCVAFSGPDALELGARERPAVLLLDIGMPAMSGYEVARRVRLEAWGKAAVLIAVTGWGQEHDKQAAKAAGFDAHLTKPIDPAAVEQTLAQLLDGGVSVGADPGRIRTSSAH